MLCHAQIKSYDHFKKKLDGGFMQQAGATGLLRIILNRVALWVSFCDTFNLILRAEQRNSRKNVTPTSKHSKIAEHL